MESIPASLVMGGISKAYLEKTLEGLGALKGSPCYVKSFEYDTNDNTIITLAWIGTDGTEETEEVTIKRGLRGLKGNTGEKGDTGVSVTGISKISEVGLAKTYRIALSNDTHFDFVVNDGMTPSLTNYYTKSQTEDLIAAIRALSLEKVTELPTENIDPLTIYLIRKEDSDVDNDVFDEYLYIEESWEHIGSTSVNLANYYTKTQTDALLEEKDVYSTTETRIGTWIDGRPIYRKVFVTNNIFPTPYSGNEGTLINNVFDYPVNGNVRVIKLYGMLSNGDGGGGPEYAMPIPQSYAPNGNTYWNYGIYFNAHAEGMADKGRVLCDISPSARAQSDMWTQAEIVIEYIKLN